MHHNQHLGLCWIEGLKLRLHVFCWIYHRCAVIEQLRKSVLKVVIIIIIIITIIIEFLTSQLWLGNIHLSWDVIINRLRLGGLICGLKSFLQLNMCQELQIFAVVYMYLGAS